MSSAKLLVTPIDVSFVLKDKVYDGLKQAILSMNVYAQPGETRLDERQLSEDFGVSRTPVREAITRLEQEGFVKVIPRRGAFVVRKTKKEILEMITVWAALESMAARLITESATDAEIASLRRMFATFDDDRVRAQIDEYSETNIEFHQAILNMSKCELLNQMAENLFAHMRWIRMRTIAEDDRASRSIIDHMHIIEALEQRDADLAERLVRAHTFGLASHVDMTAHYLD
ncbi:MAG: FCD domain-containing protein [Alphaproteobacteria bacterium]|nr:FCD domain-containing protein [Alphaproteobacteria bacterium]